MPRIIRLKLLLRSLDLLELGRKLIIAAIVLRNIEKLHARIVVYDWIPTLASADLSPFSTPTEFWSLPLSGVAYGSGILLGLAGIISPNWRWLTLPVLFLQGAFVAWGNYLIGGGALFIQPALLVLSFEAWFRARHKNFPTTFCLLTLLISMYFVNGVRKTGAAWVDGHALSLYLTSNVSLVPHRFDPNNFPLRLATWFVRYWEIAGLLLAIPFAAQAQRNLRRIYALIAFLFHGAIFFTSTLKVFSIALFGGWIFVIAGDFSWQKWWVVSSLRQRLLGFLWLWVICWPSFDLLHPGLLPPQTYTSTMIRLQLFPYWSLFGPSPEFGYLKGSILLPNGKRVTADGSRPKLSLLGSLTREPRYWTLFKRNICRHGPGKIIVTYDTEKKGLREKHHQCVPTHKTSP